MKATKLIKEATADLERRHSLDRNSLVVKSHLAWASWISRACDIGNFIGRAGPPRPRDFKELDIDPRGEIQYIEDSGRRIEQERREEAVPVRPSFEAGHYREGNNTIHFGSGDPGLNLLYEFDQLTETVGIPIHINHVNVCADAAMAAVVVAHQPNIEWYVCLLRALHSYSDKQFEAHFTRVSVAQIPIAIASALLSAVESAVTFWTQRFKDARGPDLRNDWSCAHDTLRLILTTLSRLTVRMSPEQAAHTLRKAIELAKEPLIRHHRLIEAIGELAKYAIKAIPPAERGAFALAMLEFPLPSEKGMHGNHPSWPQIVFDMWNLPPVRGPADTNWDHRVNQLLAATQIGNADRELAVPQLAYLAVNDALKPDEMVAFGNALWSDPDAQDGGLPANTGLNSGVFLRLPAADGIDKQARLSARLLDSNLHEVMRLSPPIDTSVVNQKAHRLASITNAARFGLVIPAERAAQMFDEITAWEFQQVRDDRDPFSASFAKSFNDAIRLASGYLLGGAVVPAMREDQRTVERARALLAFIARAQAWTGMQALPHFLASAEEVTADVISTLRAGLLGSDSQQVGSAAQAIARWAKFVRSGTLPQLPEALIERLITTIEVRRAIGLATMLAVAVKLLQLDFFEEEQLRRLVDTIAEIRAVRYEDIPLNSMEAVSASLVRVECVKLAVALKERVADDGALQAWIDEAKNDPLPEVRFSLANPVDDDPE